MGSDVSTVTRRCLLVGAVAIAAGCLDADSNGDERPVEGDGEGESDSGQSADDGPKEDGNMDANTLALASPAFDDGERIPEKYGYDAENVNPPLEIKNVPEATDSLVIVVDDPDAVEPAGKVWVHWIVWNIPPAVTTIPEGWRPDEAVEGTNDFSEIGYGGPSPPDSEHRYRFKLFALDTKLELSSDADAERLETAMEGHVIERVQLDGTYPA